MTSEQIDTPTEGPPPPRRWAVLLACALLVVAAVAVYANCLHNPFLFDDRPGILGNPHIRQLWPPQVHLDAHQDAPTQGRPLVSFTFALNYAFGEVDPAGYRAVNIAIHVIVAMLLLGVIRRTLAGPSLGERFGRSALPIAFASALLWTVHPLNSECINYVSQRTESLMSLFALLTLYCAIRAAESRYRRLWQVGAVAACAAGMMCKEVMVVVPVLVLLHDWAFRTRPFKAVLASRWRMYLGLAATWGVLAWLMIAYPRVTVGFAEVSPLQYAQNQVIVIMNYVRLSIWPHPVVVDYGPARPVPLDFKLMVRGLALLALLAATVRALKNSPQLGFLGAWFFIALAPTSSVVPIVTEVGADRRMYLPLASVVPLALIAGYALLKRFIPAPKVARPVGLVLAIAAAVALGETTRRTNTHYRSSLSVWRAAVIATPNNPRALNNFSDALRRHGYDKEAVTYARRAVGIDGDYVDARCSLGSALASQGKYTEAIEHFRRALDLGASRPLVHKTLADILLATNRSGEALDHYRLEMQLNPDHPDAYLGAARILSRRGGPDALEAVRLAEKAAALTRRGDAGVLDTLAAAYAAAGQHDDAIAAARQALQLATQAGNNDLAQKIRRRLARYQQTTTSPATSNN